MNFKILQLRNTKIYNFSEDKNPIIHHEFIQQFDELYMNYLTENGYFGYENENVTVKKNDIVVDCGANMGLFSAWAASKGGIVYSFEPGKTAQYYLNKTKELYPYNIKIIPYGVSNIQSQQEYTECINIAGSHLSRINLDQQTGFKDKYLIQTISLDEYFQNIKIDFIKIDTEGSEKEIILGAKNIIYSQSPKMVIACYHYKDDNINLANLIYKINPNYKIIEQNKKLFCFI